MEDKKEKPEAGDSREEEDRMSAQYRKNPKTGLWEIINPSGSMAYNYLYRDDPELD